MKPTGSMNKDEMAAELRERGFAATAFERRDDLRRRLADARHGARRKNRGWK